MSATDTGSAEAKRIASTIRSCSATGGASKRLASSSSCGVGSVMAVALGAADLDRGEGRVLPKLQLARLGQLQRGGEGRRRRGTAPGRAAGPAIGQIAHQVRPGAG